MSTELHYIKLLIEMNFIEERKKFTLSGAKQLVESFNELVRSKGVDEVLGDLEGVDTWFIEYMGNRLRRY